MPSSTPKAVGLAHPRADIMQQGRRLDIGRVVGVPIMTGLLILNVSSALHAIQRDGVPLRLVSVGGLAASGLTACLYVLLIAAFMRRSPAKATHPSRVAALAALVATWLPFAIPLLPHGTADAAAILAANTLLLGGLAFSVWSIRYLDRSFSMVAQARAVVRSGPYAFVRHPLYTGELAALLGTVLTRPGVWTFVGWASILSLQIYRARHEEAILLAELEDYADYQRTTPQLVPFTVSRSLRRLTGRTTA